MLAITASNCCAGRYRSANQRPSAHDHPDHLRHALSFSRIHEINSSPSAGPRPVLVKRSAATWLGAAYHTPSRWADPSNTPSSLGSMSNTLAPVPAGRSESRLAASPLSRSHTVARRGEATGAMLVAARLPVTA